MCTRTESSRAGKAARIAILIAAPGLANVGCGTYIGHVAPWIEPDCVDEGAPPYLFGFVYTGVQVDALIIGHAFIEKELSAASFLLDLPFSLAADTALLPFTLPHAIVSAIRGREVGPSPGTTPGACNREVEIPFAGRDPLDLAAAPPAPEDPPGGRSIPKVMGRTSPGMPCTPARRR